MFIPIPIPIPICLLIPIPIPIYRYLVSVSVSVWIPGIGRTLHPGIPLDLRPWNGRRSSQTLVWTCLQTTNILYTCWAMHLVLEEIKKQLKAINWGNNLHNLQLNILQEINFKLIILFFQPIILFIQTSRFGEKEYVNEALYWGLQAGKGSLVPDPFVILCYIGKRKCLTTTKRAKLAGLPNHWNSVMGRWSFSFYGWLRAYKQPLHIN